MRLLSLLQGKRV